MKILSLKSLIAASSLLALAACGGKTGAIVNKAVHGGGQLKDAEALASLSTGVWKSPCMSTHLNILDLGGEKVEYVVHTDGSLTRRTILFEKNDCSTKAVQVEENGTFSGSNFHSVAPDMYAIDENWKNVKVTPLSDSAVTKMNILTGFCNINNWMVNGQQDVTSQTESQTCVGISKTPRMEYDLFNITGNSNSELYIGIADPSHNKSSPAARPTSVDFQEKYSH